MMMDVNAVDTAARTVSDGVATLACDYRRRDGRRNGGRCRRAIAAACECQSCHLWKQLLFELPTGNGQSSSCLNSATNFLQVACSLEWEEPGVSVRARISRCNIRENWRTRHDSNV
jgi:hypothetical protein